MVGATATHRNVMVILPSPGMRRVNGAAECYPHIINTGTQVPVVSQSSMEYLGSTTLVLKSGAWRAWPSQVRPLEPLPPPRSIVQNQGKKIAGLTPNGARKVTYPLAPEGAFFIGKSKTTNNVVPRIINTF